MHLGAMDEVARDTRERSQGLPVEIGGLLLGHVTRGDKPAVWVERCHRVECEHRSGPNFALSAEEMAALEARAAKLSGELNVLGFYRSHLRAEAGLDASDRDLIARYFKDADDRFLLVSPEPGQPGKLRGQFFAHGEGDAIRALEPSFPFSGRPGAAATAQPPARGERLGRLVPDFIPSVQRVELREPPLVAAPAFTEDLELTRRRGWGRRWPWFAALVLGAAGGAILLRQAVEHRAPAPESAAAPPAAVLPLGLFVDPTAASWSISWSPSAAAALGARGVQLFIRDGGDDQNRIELSPEDLRSGTYRYQAKGQDVTFRLEATDAAGRISAESFRVLKTAEKPATPAAAAASTPPKAIEKVAPVVPASVRPRIRGKIPIDVRVQVDAAGRVVAALPVTKAHSGLETFLAGRAVAAAKQWKFKPARADGKAVAGSEILQFTFEK
jgi:hypothetical protein